MKILTVRAKAFTGFGIETVKVRVDGTGDVLVWDDIAKHFTRCHSLSKSAQLRIKKLWNAHN